MERRESWGDFFLVLRMVYGKLPTGEFPVANLLSAFPTKTKKWVTKYGRKIKKKNFKLRKKQNKKITKN